MLTNNPKINKLKYDDAVSRLMENEDTRHAITTMSFGDYHRLIEATADIVPSPSGQKVIAPQAKVAPPTPVAGQQNAVPGTAAPIGAMNTQVPTQPGQPANAAAAVGDVARGLLPPGAQVPTIPAKAGSGGQTQQPLPGQPIVPGQQTIKPTEEEAMIKRLRELAGIGEDGSAGGTGAGAIAMAPTSMGMKKRTEESPSLEHPVAGRKTIVGATGPQASAVHKLSANNATKGNPTPFRKQAGIR